MDTMRASENLQQIKQQFETELGLCSCGDFAVVVKAGPYTGKPFELCAEHSALWTEQRLGIKEAA